MALLVFYALPVFFFIIFFVHHSVVRPTRKRASKKDKKRASIGNALLPQKESVSDTIPSDERSQLDLDKQLYHQLQNLEYYPNALPVAYNRLLSLFDAAIDSAQSSTTPTILNAVPEYSAQLLNDFMNQEYEDISVRFEAYLERRKKGGAREIFPDYEYARYWLRTVAPVKFVDGAWLGGVHRVTTDPRYRSITKTLWQVLSEELGDGDLQKNHVWVYQELLKSIDADDIGTGDSKQFVSSSRNVNNDRRVWTAALAQLCISLFPDLFLPEILGFNMSYESLPLHLLITVHELRELKIDPYYFVLHISIDNKHSGHAAMGINAVNAYMSSLPIEERNAAWKRIQAGFILASELPTTPAPRSALDRSVEELFAAKAEAAHPLHMSCPAKIGGRTGKKLSDWLNPNAYGTHSMAFLRALADSRWIVRGKPEKSRLIAEVKWGGRMFGAFTSEEVATLEAWIRELGSGDPIVRRTNSYESLTGVQTAVPNVEVTHTFNDILARPSAPRHRLLTLTGTYSSLGTPGHNRSHALRSLLSISAVPFEYLASLPAKCASSYGMIANRCLRALYGFLPESDVCAGMYEVLSNASSTGVMEIAQITMEDMYESVRDFAEEVLRLSAFPEQNQAILVGLQSGFVEYVFDACQQLEEIPAEGKQKLREIQIRCRNALNDLIKEKSDENQWLKQVLDAKTTVKSVVSAILS